jgi:hypothetical protein
LLFRIGARRSEVISIDPDLTDFLSVARFIESNAKDWGTPNDLMIRARKSAMQAIVSMIDHCSPRGPIKIKTSYDEFDTSRRGKTSWKPSKGATPTRERA